MKVLTKYTPKRAVLLGVVDMNKEELKKEQKQELPRKLFYARKYIFDKYTRVK